MKILICEDEAPAGRQISKLIRHLKPHAEILAVVESGKQAREWLEATDGEKPDLVFLDIELADGSCFDTLDQVHIGCPVVFTTAYDHYALQAFKLNGIDYLIKPITEEKLKQTFNRIESVRSLMTEENGIKVSRELFEHQSYKERFLIKIGQKLIPIQVSEIAWFRAEDRVVWLYTHEGKKYIINYTLTDLEQMLDPKLFFRLNRQYLASRVSVSELYPYFKGQVVVQLKPKSVDEIVVSRIQTPALKEWLDG